VAGIQRCLTLHKHPEGATPSDNKCIVREVLGGQVTTSRAYRIKE